MPDPAPESGDLRPEQIDLCDPELFRYGFPHHAFEVLRREAPVHWYAFPEGFEGDHDPGIWVLSRHADVQAANRDTERFCAIDGPQLALQPAMGNTMLVTMDGSAHVRQRRLISAGFTPRMVGRIEDQARSWAVSIIENALERETCDFVSEVAYQLPMHMIADIVGIPVEDRQALFTLVNEFLLGAAPDRALSHEAHMAKQGEMFQYARDLGQRKQQNPADDIWTILSTLEVENEDGEPTRLSEVELDFFFLLLTVAGSETTRNAIAQGLLVLLDHPDQMEQMRREPEAMRPAVEEILRWSSPVSYFARRAKRDTEIAGVRIAQGDRLTLWYPSANRDDAVFDDPYRFDIRRTPNHHVAFGGGGAHFCLGANLARREIAILFEELLARVGEIEVLGEPRFTPLGIYNPVGVALTGLPVRLSRAQG